MGVESDHLVYDYLSRVGDLAQTALPADRRMRLVAELRKSIDHERSRSSSRNDEATVRRILAELGTPDEVVKAARATGTPAADARGRVNEPDRQRPRHAGEPQDAAKAAGESEPAIPLPRDEAEFSGGDGRGPEWWRVPEQRSSAARTNELLAGWTGGLEPPELDDENDEDDEDGPNDEFGPGEAGEAAEERAQQQDDGPGEVAPGRLRRALRVRRRRPSPDGDAVVVRRRRLPVGPLELVAALALIAGVVAGSWWALAVGWLIAYTTRGLTRTEAKWTVLGMPGLVAAGALVWLWGRTNGRWGRPVSDGKLGPVIVADFPVVVKMAAIASALFLLWRSSRRFR
jgi:hypothetical protein